MYGSKIDNLIKMKESGINVPDFKVIDFETASDEKKLDKFLSETTFTYPVAVRSSCNLEDGSDQSFAGQFSTYLNVNPGEILEKIRLCVDSLSSENVLEYMKKENIDPSDAEMNVIIQEMVDADLSGVMFTSNPQGLLNETVIVAGRGLGEGVVSDRTDTTTYYYQRMDKLYYYEGEALLSEKQIELLIETAEKLEELFDFAVDCEYALKGDKLYMLQARPITTLKSDHPLILDNSNIVESYPGLSLPLTISFVHMVYAGVFRGVSARVLKNDKELNKHEDVFGHMVGHANGRLYYKISNWYTVLKFLPFRKKIIPVWQEMLGVKNKSYDSGDVDIPASVRFMTYINSFTELKNVPKHMKELEVKFDEVNRHFYKTYSDDMSPKDLIGLYEEIKSKLLNVWDVTLLNDMYAFIFTGLVKKRLLKKTDGDEAYVNRYISGITDIESMKPIRALVDLAYNKDKISEEEFDKRKAEYIKQFGDRNLEELKLESKTYRSNPELLDERIESYRSDPKRLEEIYKDLNKPSTSESAGDAITRFLGKRCALGIAGRERSRLNRSRIYGMVRLIFTGLGSAYSKAGYIIETDDIFWLTIDEAFGLADKPCDMTAEVERRKDSYRLYAELPAYSRLIFADKEFDKIHSKVNTYTRKKSDTELQGVPCSAGEVTGEALVIQNVNDAKNVKDKILITKMTDPGWVFLLATAAGVISEKGSLLSHTAIISRELKVPSVVGVEDLMDTVKTGDIIRMNGGTGKITILERKDNGMH